MSEDTPATPAKATSATAVYGKKMDAVHCLLLPIFGEDLLLPNAAVAEVVSYSEPEVVAEAPEWLLGRIAWRDQYIPLISFEVASGGELPPVLKQSRIAVLNTLNGNSALPYIGVVTQGIPHLQVVQERGIERDEEPADPRTSVADYVTLNGESALVPDLDNLEQRLLRLQKG